MDKPWKISRENKQVMRPMKRTHKDKLCYRRSLGSGVAGEISGAFFTHTNGK